MSTIAVKKVKLGNNADISKNFLIEVPAVADGTLTIKREDGTNVLSIDANGKAVIPGVVGTVAQVGGIPTGQVVERGSNANGDYVRFADGTQICVGSVPNGALPTVSFPATFSAVPHIPGGANRNANNVTDCYGVFNTVSVSGFQARWSTRTDAIGSYIAIGRWF